MASSTQAPSLSMTLNHDTPEEQRHAGQPQSQQQQRGAEKAQALGAALARQFAEHAAGAVRQPDAAPMQRGETAAGDQRQHEAERRAAGY